MRSTSIPVLLAFVAVGAASAQTERRTLSGRDVAIYDLVGRVSVEAGTGSDVTVEVTRRGADSRGLVIETGDVRGRNALRVIFPDDDIIYPEIGRWSSTQFTVDRDGTWGSSDLPWSRRRRVRVRGSGRGAEAWADIRVIVPAGKRVSVNVGVGELEARQVDGDLTLDVASAHVTVTGTKGNLRVDTGSGGAEIRDVTGDDVSIETGSGGVRVSNVSGRRLKLDTGSGGLVGGGVSTEDLYIDVGSGSVRLDDVTATNGRVETGSGGIELRLKNSPRSLSVEAGSGGVTMYLPPNLNAELDVNTGSGGISSDFPIEVNRYDRHHVRGRIGNGEGRIRIESGSGSVRLRKG